MTKKKKSNAGRPRTVSPPEKDLIALGKEMVAWVKDNEQKVLHISEWYCIHKEILTSVWETMIKRPEFVSYYEQALKIIGKKYLDKDSNVREGVSQRWQRSYFKDLRKEEDQDAQDKLDRELDKEKKKIDYEESKKLTNIVSPYQDSIAISHENMMLKAEITNLKAKLDALNAN